MPVIAYMLMFVHISYNIFSVLFREGGKKVYSFYASKNVDNY